MKPLLGLLVASAGLVAADLQPNATACWDNCQLGYDCCKNCGSAFYNPDSKECETYDCTFNKPAEAPWIYSATPNYPTQCPPDIPVPSGSGDSGSFTTGNAPAPLPSSTSSTLTTSLTSSMTTSTAASSSSAATAAGTGKPNGAARISGSQSARLIVGVLLLLAA